MRIFTFISATKTFEIRLLFMGKWRSVSDSAVPVPPSPPPYLGPEAHPN